MKNILIILISLLIISCSKNASDVRQIKAGISTNELKYIMGEPREIRVQNGHEKWYFHYNTNGIMSVQETLVVTISDDKIITFESY